MLEQAKWEAARAELLETWPARALLGETDGKRYMVLLSVLAHNYDDHMLTLLHAVYPGFKSITAPFLCSAGTVEKTGAISADMVTNAGRIRKAAVLYRNEIDLRDDFRRLADSLKFNDQDREQLFIAVRKWVVADRRLDPSMDPKDPDAKRLVIH